MKSALIGRLFGFVSFASADSWLSPTPKTYASTSGIFRLTIFPKPIAIALREDEGEVFAPSQRATLGQLQVEATLEKLAGDHYESVWRKPLVNFQAPVSALVSDLDGSFVTFDEWGTVGTSENVIVVYNAGGEMVKRFTLFDFARKEELAIMPRTSSSHWWAGIHELVPRENVVRVQIVTSGNEQKGFTYRTIRIRLADGAILD